MKRGRQEVPQHIIRQMFILQSEGMSYNKIGERLNVAPNTVRTHLNKKDNIAKHGDLLHEIEEINQKSNHDIIELIKSNRYSEIANNIVDMFNKDNLEEERQSNGIRNLISLLGNTVDKTIKLKNLEIREKELEISLRQLELKEKELNARLENPEAFVTPIIIDDSQSVAEWYKTNGTDKPYIKN